MNHSNDHPGSHELPTSLELMEPDARRELLVAYLDGELSPEATRHVTAWLDENPAALREVEHWRQTWTLLDHYEDEPVPADFAARVFDAVGLKPAERQGKVLRMAWYRRPLATAAAVVLAVGATVFVMKQGGTLLLEHGESQQQEIARIMAADGWSEISHVNDLAAKPRVTIAMR